jgi:hypothetical protein
MPKKGEKVVSEERLEALAKARMKALEVRRANKDIKDKEKELAKLEKNEKKVSLESRIKQKRTALDTAGNEVPVAEEKQQVEQSNLELETEEPKSKPIDIPQKKASRAKKIKYVYESDSSSEEEIVVVRKKKAGRAKKIEDSNNEVDKDVGDTVQQNNAPATRPPTAAEIQRQQYLSRVSQMPQYRTNLFGGF